MAARRAFSASHTRFAFRLTDDIQVASSKSCCAGRLGSGHWASTNLEQPTDKNQPKPFFSTVQPVSPAEPCAGAFEMDASHTFKPAITPADGASGPAVLLRDSQGCVPVYRFLRDNDIIVMLTPVVPLLGRGPPTSRDPFETLGRAIFHRHPFVRHVPYTKEGGITSTHVGLLKFAKMVIFVVSGPPGTNEKSQADLASLTQRICQSRPQIVVGCSQRDHGEVAVDHFPTVVHVGGYATGDLNSVVSLLFGEQDFKTIGTGGLNPTAPMSDWMVETWHPMRDLQQMHQLWNSTLPHKYHLNDYVFQQLVHRDGYVKHFVVRDPQDGTLLGACLTYTTFIDSGDGLIGSLAAVLVRPDCQRRGMGKKLHDTALQQLRTTRGVVRLQLGSTFPRLLYGLPSGSEATEWFRNRGWTMCLQETGMGQHVSDWYLTIEDLPQASGTALLGLKFKSCDPAELKSVIGFAENEARRRGQMGWYDQYAKLNGTPHVEDIIVGIQGGRIVATALTYYGKAGSPIADDLPWAATISDNVGGVTCICVPGMFPGMIIRLPANFLDRKQPVHDTQQRLGHAAPHTRLRRPLTDEGLCCSTGRRREGRQRGVPVSWYFSRSTRPDEFANQPQDSTNGPSTRRFGYPTKREAASAHCETKEPHTSKPGIVGYR